MKKNNQSIYIVSCVMVMSLALYGCSSSKNEQESPPTTPIAISANQPVAEVDSSSTNIAPEVETKPITITVINLSKADVGMFSVFDPLLNQQIDVNEIASDGTLSFSCNWPIDVKNLQWAIYDKEGDLLLESTTDITECEEKISILLSGENTIDDVDVLFD